MSVGVRGLLKNTFLLRGMRTNRILRRDNLVKGRSGKVKILHSLTIAGFIGLTTPQWSGSVFQTALCTQHGLPLRCIPPHGSTIMFCHFNPKRKKFNQFMWILMGGGVATVVYLLCSFISFVSLIGFNQGISYFELAKLCWDPFGKDLLETGKIHHQTDSLLFSVRLIPVITHFVLAGFNFASIIGIVFAEEHFRLAFLAFSPESRAIYEYTPNATKWPR